MSDNELDLSIPTTADDTAINLAPAAATDTGPKLGQNLRGETKLVVVNVSRGVVHLVANTKGVRQGQGADYHNFPLATMTAAILDGRKTLILRDYRKDLRAGAVAIRAMVPTVRRVGRGLLNEIAAASGGSDASRIRDGVGGAKVKVSGTEFWFGSPIVHSLMPSSSRANAKNVDDPNKGTGYASEDDRHALFVSWDEMPILADYLDSLADGSVVDTGLSKSVSTRRSEFAAEARRIADANGYLFVELSGDEEYVPAPVASSESSETPPANTDKPRRPRA